MSARSFHGCLNRSGEVIRRVRPDDPKVDFGTRTGPDWIPVSGILVPGRPGHRMSGFTDPGRTTTGPDVLCQPNRNSASGRTGHG